MILLLDTTVLIDALKPRAPRRALLVELISSGHRLTTAAVNVVEVYAGIRPEEVMVTTSFFERLHCYPMTESIARRAGQMKSSHARAGRTFSLTDMMVAATALEHGLPVVTDNHKDFVTHGLTLFPLPRS